MRKWALFLIKRAPYMVLLFTCLAVALVFACGLVSVSAEFDPATRVAQLSYQISHAGVDVLPAGAWLSFGMLGALCVVLPLLRLTAGIMTGALCSLAIVIIQHALLPFNHPQPTALLLCMLAVVSAFIVFRGVIVMLHRRQVNQYLQQYVPPELVEYHMHNPVGALAGESRDMTIMFCDIKRFTGISERLDPELLPDWLNRFFDVVCEIVAAHGGTIDKYIGDSVMAFWGAPNVSESHACDALKAAQEIIPAVEALSERLVAEGLPPIAVGIGLSTGSANVGHLGSKERMTYTVVGDAVNTADRLQRCTGVYDLSLVVNDRMTEQVPDYLFRELDTVHVKGRQRFVRIFQPICHQDEAVPNTHRRLQMHRKAMQFYRRGMWADAEKLFRALGDETGERLFYKRYIERIVSIRQTDPSADTSFVVDFTQKIG